MIQKKTNPCLDRYSKWNLVAKALSFFHDGQNPRALLWLLLAAGMSVAVGNQAQHLFLEVDTLQQNRFDNPSTCSIVSIMSRFFKIFHLATIPEVYKFERP